MHSFAASDQYRSTLCVLSRATLCFSFRRPAISLRPRGALASLQAPRRTDRDDHPRRCAARRTSPALRTEAESRSGHQRHHGGGGLPRARADRAHRGAPALGLLRVPHPGRRRAPPLATTHGPGSDCARPGLARHRRLDGLDARLDDPPPGSGHDRRRPAAGACLEQHHERPSPRVLGGRRDLRAACGRRHPPTATGQALPDLGHRDPGRWIRRDRGRHGGAQPRAAGRHAPRRHRRARITGLLRCLAGR